MTTAARTLRVRCDDNGGDAKGSDRSASHHTARAVKDAGPCWVIECSYNTDAKWHARAFVPNETQAHECGKNLLGASMPKNNHKYVTGVRVRPAEAYRGEA